MGFLSGFFAGYFARALVSVIIVFSAFGLISHLASGRPPVEMLVISGGGMLLILPIIACIFHYFMMTRKGLPSYVFVVLRGVYWLYILLCLAFAALHNFLPRIPEAILASPENEAMILSVIKNEALAQSVLNLSQQWRMVILAAPFLVVVLLMGLVARRLKQRLANAAFNYEANVVAEGVRRGLSQ